MGWRARNGTRREVFEGCRVILEGGKQVGLGKMAGIARLRKETQIRQFQDPYHTGHVSDCRRIYLLLNMRVDKHQDNQNSRSSKKYQAWARFSQGKSGLAGRCLYYCAIQGF
jgi:hypothetical protein